MRRPEHLIQIATGLCALATGSLAIQWARYGGWGQAAAFALLTAPMAAVFIREAERARERKLIHRAHLARLRARDNRARQAADDIALAWDALGTSCCIEAWVSKGEDHSRTRCTRNDQRNS